ncbi:MULTISPECIES: succinate dehydrogenase, hydrophobic membrane anchor protein [Undibacterium]|jgi:succinate dehydrogenase / fumarate reductase membrane anchor subunit|uniref:Succinate dehydrogenase hydrophobic membrane anchor subunit n=1 Tax=Undibacterium aquatile TaxID=1537398 RepID=A0ABR6XD01_9BURK|nr:MULTISPECIES: succinate dehydrogenase, hydrophobic membrane anchor protein [Undibacterium]MBC3810789.1 succinate dehydrogenase, hydrophobic membrane anchor protein [Undibacterium aquatile]MBC3878987.1 succinate dehydrogenase, hydrophobic membrane anchor protein [Undibacterium sp. FT79W]MBC3928265.1 succinate dehydrogenase, hydrophobic membrane anchor protein [Undibacterium sp. CY21W]MBK1890969.1 succinate dehydrogenase, hydrophobic membrane anchor protein [Undibacterium sp. 14-3-2]
MANNNIGPKRLVVGAHYGVRDWLAQRVTAIVMASYTVILLAMFLTGSNFTYEGWAGIFAQQWFKLATFSVVICLLYHAWVGMRDVWMDYVTHNVFVRLVFQVATILWLVASAGYAAQILWRV